MDNDAVYSPYYVIFGVAALIAAGFGIFVLFNPPKAALHALQKAHPVYARVLNGDRAHDDCVLSIGPRLATTYYGYPSYLDMADAACR